MPGLNRRGTWIVTNSGVRPAAIENQRRRCERTHPGRGQEDRRPIMGRRLCAHRKRLYGTTASGRGSENKRVTEPA